MGNTRTLILARCAGVVALASLMLGLPRASSAATPFVHETVSAFGATGLYTSLVLDARGNPHISFDVQTGDDVVYAVKTGSTWTIEVADATGNVGTYTSLALDAQGNPHISYLDVTNSDLKHAAKSGSSWTVETVDALGNVGVYTSIALEAGGNPRVAYYDATNLDLKYAAKNGLLWTIETVEATGIVGSYASLAIDAQGNPHVSYYDDTNDDLKHAVKNGGSWTLETVDATGNVGQYTSIALDSQGNPRVSYYDATNGDLKFAAKSGSSWTIETIDAPGTVGQHTALALDGQGNARVCYYDNVNDDLKYAAKSGSSWSSETVDALGNVGQYASLALDAQGNPRISYHDITNLDLKYTDSAVRVVSPTGGLTWAVGSVQEVQWTGSGSVDILLSADGGSTFTLVKDNYITNRLALRVPHTPSRFAQIRVSRSSPFSVDECDSFFTIDATIALAKFDATRSDDRTRLTWETRPGPEADIRYRIERGSDGTSFISIADGLDRGEFVDPSPATASRYRLIAINGLGEEYVLGETSVTGALAADRDIVAYPNPASGPIEILYRVPFDRPMDLTVYDLSGRRIRSLVSSRQPVGVQSVTWDHRDEAGRDVAAGTYFARLTSGDGFKATERVTIVR